MISLASIWAITIRHIKLLPRDLNPLLAVFYWPLIDILRWGFLGTWIAQFQLVQFNNYEFITLMGVILWQVVARGGITIALTFMEELWANNIINLFSLPLALSEWMCGVLLFYAILMNLTFAFCMLMTFILYNLPLWQVFTTFLIFFPPLFFCCIWIGFTSLQIIVLLGKRSMEIGYVIGWFFMPFSGAYYPVDALPAWGKVISACLPMSYVFTGMRGYLMHQQDPTVYLLKGYALSILYAVCAVVLFVYCFNYSKQKGLARLAD